MDDIPFSFALTTDPVICDAGIVAFFVDLDFNHPDVSASDFSTFYLGPPADPRLVARQGDPVPGHPGETFGQFYLFTALGLNREGWAVIENNDVHMVRPDSSILTSLVSYSNGNPSIDIGGGVTTPITAVKLVRQRLATGGNDGLGMQISDREQVLVQLSYDSGANDSPGVFIMEYVPPSITFRSLAVAGANTILEFSSTPGEDYRVQRKGATGDWSTVELDVTGQGTTSTFVHTNGANVDVSLYRVLLGSPGP